MKKVFGAAHFKQQLGDGRVRLGTTNMDSWTGFFHPSVIKHGWEIPYE
jgi:hypothetical protein